LLEKKNFRRRNFTWKIILLKFKEIN